MIKKYCWVFVFICMLFISPTLSLAKSNELIIHEETRAIWQANTTKPSSSQLIQLFDVTNTNGEQTEIFVDDTQVNYEKPGRYRVLFSLHDNEEKVGILTIKQSSPILFDDTSILQFKVNGHERLTTKMLSRFFAHYDAYTFSIVYENINYNRIGTYPVTIEIEDPFGRKKETMINVEIVDAEAPFIRLTKNELHYELHTTLSDEKIIKDASIVVTDNVDSNIVPRIDWYSVNTNEPGEYTVKISAIDKAGNMSAVHYVTIMIDQEMNFKNTLTYEVHSIINEATLLNDLQIPSVEKINMNRIDFHKVGTYVVQAITETGEIHDVFVQIVDTEPPNIMLRKDQLAYGSATDVSFEKIIEDAEMTIMDNYDENVLPTFSLSEEDLKKEGQHQVIVYAIDSSGNKTSSNIQVRVGEGEIDSLALGSSQTNNWSYGEHVENNRFKQRVIQSVRKENIANAKENEPIEKVSQMIQSNETKQFPFVYILFIVLFIIVVFIIYITKRKSKKVDTHEIVTRRFKKGI